MVLFEKVKGVAYATLNREKALNSLNLEMVTALLKQFTEWQSDPEVNAIVLRGAGARSFCSGGDVKSVCLAAREGDLNYGARFFEIEYQLDYLVHTSVKPIVVLGHGIVMGGGIGLMNGAQVRVATTSSIFAMPEISIGLFPDVGGSYFLNRMPEGMGLFLALTAARLNATDAVELGLADLIVPDEQLDSVQTLVANSKTNELKDALLAFSKPFQGVRPESQALKHLREIQDAILPGLRSSDPEQIFKGMDALTTHESPWLAKAAQSFAKGSPTSAHLIVEQLRRGKTLSLRESFEMELVMAIQCCRHHDFPEGVRAVLIDKDQSPKWNPPSRELVSRELIEEHFHLHDAVMLVIRKEGRYLFIQRAPHDSAGGYWCPVSGRVEPGETQEQTVIREAMEEVGLHVKPIRKLDQTIARTAPYRLHWWLTEAIEGQASPRTSEVADLRWVAPSEFGSLQPAFSEDLELLRRLDSFL